ncbi:plasmid pRiA4b ORF-3 family protein [Pelomicrobium methylotrophicum]|uniref:Plasmid pRiA4b ORF-3 family protein n=1 Tax=Pelomicrobium methylotrophicum TaxID=2602750 RepID=A0A5C7EJ70_9PROT|nr:plasmid pRiA4b ORF-3 family protein [Pelomicrobium methylotrophicum]TXF11468.1 plasmid pRiA4b ORF-3 family protein [Pelomicrobium methylotrophicum]
MRYVYDFGNGWEHRIRAEKSLSLHAYPCAPFAWPERMPVPPEDVGDPDGYFDFLRPLPAPAIPDRKRYSKGVAVASILLPSISRALAKRFQRIKP